MSNSFAGIQAAPCDRARLQVYADELLEQGDSGGELIRLQLSDCPLDDWFSVHGERLLTSLGRPEAIRIQNGLIHQVVFGQHWLSAPSDALARHPLAVLRPPTLGKEDGSSTLRALAAMLESSNPFGLELSASEDFSAKTLLHKRIAMLTTRALSLSSELAPWLEGVETSQLQALKIPAATGPLHHRPLAKTVSWLSVRSLEHLSGLLMWPALRVLDLRGVVLDAPSRGSLTRWAQVDARTVLHEHFTLIDPHPLGDVFAPTGDFWPRAPSDTVLASARFDEFACATGKTLRGYLEGEPAWKVELPSRPTVLSGHRDGFDLSLENGSSLSFDRNGKAVTGRPAPAPVDGRRAQSPSGEARIEGNHVIETDVRGHELARWTLGSGLQALMATAGGYLCGTRHRVWALERGQPPRQLTADEDGRQLLWATNGEWVVVSFDSAAVSQLRFDGSASTSCWWPDTFSRGKEPLRVSALAVEPEGRALVSLGDGALNLLDPTSGTAFKPKEHPDQPYRHWVFVYGSNILVSD